jgi:hypothetical protein
MSEFTHNEEEEIERMINTSNKIFKEENTTQSERQNPFGCSCNQGTKENPVFGGYARCPIHSTTSWFFDKNLGRIDDFEMMESLKEANKNMQVTLEIVGYIKEPHDAITTEVMKDLGERAKRGKAKYNTSLQENNHQNMLQHAYEEALDLAQYLKKEITTLKTIQDLVKQYSNNQELGEVIRKMYGQK